MAPIYSTLIISLLTLFTTLNSQSDNDTLPTLNCISTDDTVIEACNGFCGSRMAEAIYIGVEEPECPLPPDYIPSLNGSNIQSAFMTTEANHDDEHESCINEDIGCGTSWLCQMLTGDESSSCSTSDFIFNTYELQCVEDKEHEGEYLYATKRVYTQFKTNQFCCNTDLCTMDESTECSYNEEYEAYTSDLFHCLYSEKAVNNEFKQITNCNATFDSNSYDDTCEYLISRSYSIFGCKCKSSFWTGHEYAEDDDNLMQLIADWNEAELESQLVDLQEYGCASNIYCVPSDDEVFTGGLLNIEQILFQVRCNVYLPYSLIDENVIEDIEEKIDTDHNRIYVTYSDVDVENDETAEGRYVDVQVVYFSQDDRDDLQKQLVAQNDYFGQGSIVSNVEGFNMNDTLTYYGADRYYPRVIRDENAALIGSIVFAAFIGLLLIILAFVCRRKGH